MGVKSQIVQAPCGAPGSAGLTVFTLVSRLDHEVGGVSRLEGKGGTDMAARSVALRVKEKEEKIYKN